MALASRRAFPHFDFGYRVPFIVLLVVIDIACAILLAAFGFGAGCWLSRQSLRAARQAREDTTRAQAVLAGIRVVTARAAGDIDTHDGRVRDINEELASEQASSPETIVSAVAKLVAANEALRQRLADADSKLREQSQQLDLHLAEAKTDILTRLPNRRAFDAEAARRYAEYQRTGTPFSLVVLDIDRFTQINETLGNQAADLLLQKVAAALLGATRVVDLPARYGGDQFAVLLPGTTIDEACEVAKRHQQAVEKAPFVCNDTKVSLTVSVGVAQVMPGEQVETTLCRAERALELAKKAGRNMSLWHDGRAIRSHVGHADQGEPYVAAEPPCETGAAPLCPATSETPRSAEEPLPPTAATTSASPGLAEKPAAQARNPIGKLLTNECDRTVFVWQVRQSIAQWNRDGVGFSVMLVQLDDYDRLRKEHGEAVADVALRATTLLLGAAVREMDVIGHYAPSCFSVLLRQTPLPEALAIAERLRNGATQCLIPTESRALEVTMSIAIAELSQGDDVLRLLRRAEAALAAAGRNRTCCHTGQSVEILEIPSG